MQRTLFTSDHEIFRETVRRFVETELVPHHAAWERDKRVPREVWRKAGAAGSCEKLAFMVAPSLCTSRWESICNGQRRKIYRAKGAKLVKEFPALPIKWFGEQRYFAATIAPQGQWVCQAGQRTFTLTAK